MDELLMCRCNICKCEFYMSKSDIVDAKEIKKYLTCPLDGRHKNISVVKKYGSYKELMDDKKIYGRVNGRVKQK